MKSRETLLYRGLAVLALVLLAALMLVIGRGHTVYLDNRSLEYHGETYQGPYKAEAFVNGASAAKLYDRERGQTICIGQTFRMSVEVTPEKGGPTETRTFTLKIPYRMDGVVINLPGLLADLPQEAWMEEFTAAPPAEEPEDAAPSGEEGLELTDI